MKRFSRLLDRLAFEPGRNDKLRLMIEYFRSVPDPERGWTLAALTGALNFVHAKPAMIRTLITERVDPVLFEMSHDYVGDLSETVALMWPSGRARGTLPSPAPAQLAQPGPLGSAAREPRSSAMVDHAAAASRPDGSPAGMAPTLTEVVGKLARLAKAELPGQLARWLDELDETGRWALLKLLTRELRVGVSARLAKTAVAALGNKPPNEVELMWPGLAPPYCELFAWAEGRAAKPSLNDRAPFRPVMLAHAGDYGDFAGLDPSEFIGEWKWDGIRVQAVSAQHDDGRLTTRLYSRSGEDISKSFPDLLAALRFDAAIDGELLVRRDGRVQPFNMLQQRLNRKTVTPKLLEDFPAHLRAYDLLAADAEDLRARPFMERRARLEALVRELGNPRVDTSPLIPFATWDELRSARAEPAAFGAGPDAAAVEGVMLKRRDAPYTPGRPKGLWWKWKRGPLLLDTVLLYAQRGHGRRSSYYSDYTFGVWRQGPEGEELVPVGKAYFGFTDEELLAIDRFVRRHTVGRFGPVREVVHQPDKGLVLEVAFEGLQRSSRHKSGLAMRFPRINRLRWDKPPREADRLETLETMLDKAQTARAAKHPGAAPEPEHSAQAAAMLKWS